MKVLLATDGSPYTQRMLDYIATHDNMFGVAPEFTAVAVVSAVPPRVSAFLDRETIDGHYQEEAERVLKPVQAFAESKQWNLKVQHRVGHAGDMIADTAKRGSFDLVVMGSHGHSSLGSLVLGSVTAQVIGRCDTPVLIVR